MKDMNLDDMDNPNHTKNAGGGGGGGELRKDKQLCTTSGTCRDIFVQNLVKILKET